MNDWGVYIVGDFRFDRLGASYQRAFADIGCRVEGFDTSGASRLLAWPGRNRWMHRLSIRSLPARRAWSRKLNLEILDSVRGSRCPWVFVINGDWLMPETVHEMKQAGKRVAIFHADNPLPPNYNNRPETMPAARESDLYLVWSRRLVDALRENGVPNVAFLPFAWDPEVFPYMGAIEQGSWRGAVFIGGWAPEREAFLDELSIHVLLRIYGPAYWGNRTRRNSRSRQCWMGRAVEGAEAAKVLRQSAVSLNLLRRQHEIGGQPDGVIMRHFEVPGCGGVLLSTRSDTATGLFPEGETGEYFTGVDECAEKCQQLVRDEGRRHRIVARCHQLVESRHRYQHRAIELLKLFAA